MPTRSLSLQIICISRIGQQIAQTCLLGGVSGMGTHGCECYLLACINGSNFHLVCISGKIKGGGRSGLLDHSHESTQTKGLHLFLGTVIGMDELFKHW